MEEADMEEVENTGAESEDGQLVEVSEESVIQQIVAEAAPLMRTGCKTALQLYYDVGSVIKRKTDEQRERSGALLMEKGFYESLADELAKEVYGDDGKFAAGTLRNWERLAKEFTHDEFVKLLEVPNISFQKIRSVIERKELSGFDDKLNYLEEAKDLSANEMKDKISEDFETSRGSSNNESDDGDSDSGGNAPPVNIQSLFLQVQKHADLVLSDIGSITIVLEAGQLDFDNDRKRENFMDRMVEASDALSVLGESVNAVIDLVEKYKVPAVKNSEKVVPKEEHTTKKSKKPKEEHTTKKSKKPKEEQKPKEEPKPKEDAPVSGAVADAIRKSKAAKDEAKKKHKG